jgi:hypothetical protein
MMHESIPPPATKPTHNYPGEINDATRSKPPRRWVMESIKLLFVMCCGLFTSLLLGAILAGIEIVTGQAAYSFTFWFILPIGAIGAGFAAAAGCYYSARWVHYYPRFLFFVSIVAIATGTLAVIHFFVWSGTTIQEVPLSELVSYQDYLRFVSHESSVSRLGHANETVQLAESVSLMYFAIQILGFTSGGIFMFFRLRNQAYCHISSSYKEKTRVVELFDRSSKAMDEHVTIIKKFLAQGLFNEAIARHPVLESMADYGHSEGARSVITFYKSKESPTTTLRHQVFVCSGRNTWKEIRELTQDYEADALIF